MKVGLRHSTVHFAAVHDCLLASFKNFLFSHCFYVTQRFRISWPSFGKRGLSPQLQTYKKSCAYSGIIITKNAAITALTTCLGFVNLTGIRLVLIITKTDRLSRTCPLGCLLCSFIVCHYSAIVATLMRGYKTMCGAWCLSLREEWKLKLTETTAECRPRKWTWDWEIYITGTSAHLNHRSSSSGRGK